MQKGAGDVGELMQKVHQGMCDDLNTPQAISALSAPLKTMNDLLSTKKGKKAKGRLHTLAQYQLGLQETLSLLGMQVAHPQEQLHEMRQLALARSDTVVHKFPDSDDNAMLLQAVSRVASHFTTCQG